MSSKVWAIIPAGGMGIRANADVPKQFLPMGQKTIIETTVSTVLSVPFVQGAIVPLPPIRGQNERLRSLVADISGKLVVLGAVLGKPIRFVEGGPTRQDSVYNAILSVPEDTEWILVHDASRPFVSQDLCQRVFAAAQIHSAAIPGIPLRDTVKKIKGTCGKLEQHKDIEEPILVVDYTVDRGSLAAIQTPQVFRADLLRRAHEKAKAEEFIGTDDSQLVERLGHHVAVVSGERSNAKLTYPEDFLQAPRPKWKWRKIFRHQRDFYPVTGLGIDIHPFSPGRKCILGGVEIPFPMGLFGHSDADVLCHAIMDGILGALSLGDIGQWFPPDDPKYLGANSLWLLGELWARLRHEAEILHVDSTVIAQAPRIMPFSEKMRTNIAHALGLPISEVSVKATTPEALGSLGRQEGIAAMAIVTLFRSKSPFNANLIEGGISHGAKGV